MPRRWNIAAWSILATVFIGMSTYLILNPTRTGVVPNYRLASSRWWAGEKIYDPGTHGFLYAPPFAVLFTPVNLLRPEILGEILWRSLGFGLFALALRSLSACRPPPAVSLSASRLPDSAFLFLVLLSVPASLASLSNGQTNLPLSACLVLAAIALRRDQWSMAGLLLTVALILKPIALAPWLLAFAVFAPVRGILLAGILTSVAIGFLHPNPSFAWQQYVGFLHKLTSSYTPENLRVSDIFGIFHKVHVPTPFHLDTITRAVVSLTALWFCWWKYRRGQIPRASWALWVGSCLVLTVFNPRAETNSYVLISPLLAFTAICSWRDGGAGILKGIILSAACIGLMCDGMGLWIYKATDVWLKPLIVLVVSPLLLRVPKEWKEDFR